jgi:hypothetical protein
MEIGNDYKISGAGKKFVSLLSPRWWDDYLRVTEAETLNAFQIRPALSKGTAAYGSKMDWLFCDSGSDAGQRF